MKKTLSIVSMIIAGESIFLLPFVIVRIFRPTILEVFNITNTELGTAFSAYGFVAMISYFFGGPLADKFKVKYLMFLALTGTSLGGLLFATIPNFYSLTILYAFWGFTTIFLFWSPLIKATREWGDSNKQGFAFGLLDSGRGLTAAIFASIIVYFYDLQLNDDVVNSDALKNTIYFASGFTFLSALLIIFFLNLKEYGTVDKIDLSKFKILLKKKQIWYQSIIIVCAYCGYKSIDDISLYTNQLMGWNEIESAKAATYIFWVRPFAALIIGFFADRVSSSRMLIVSFLIMIISTLLLGLNIFQDLIAFFFLLNIVFTGIGIYSLRALYFAVMEESKIPLALTGTAVGLVSVIGYTPDIFMGPLMGIILDNNPGAVGHQYFFYLISLFGFVGLVFSWLIYRENIK